ncbi:MAG TPA: AAA family ATPase [Polyangia bacterium]|nr:AAA family ATPase [Polyangia bacterium]
MAVHDFTNIDILERYGRELTGDPLATGDKTYGRAVELDALARALAGHKSAVLLGPPGVGKTAILRKFLYYLKAGRLPHLAGTRLYEISTAGLCADTGYTGEMESKMRALLHRAHPERAAYITDLWNLPTAGSYESNPRGIYDLLRPGIESGRLLLVGEMGEGRWERLCRKYPTLARDFTTVEVRETDEETTREILARTAGDLGAAPYNARFEKSAVDRAHSLARKFLPTLSFPGKGVDLLRKVAQAAQSSVDSTKVVPIDAALVEKLFGQMSGLPLHMISSGVKVTYEEMRDFLGERVLGQDEAVAAVADVLALYKTGLKNPDRPAGVLLFVGPTGVGKTELAKATAEFLFGSPNRMFRIDLSEYKDFHSFEKLIGGPHQSSDSTGKIGLLTDHVRQHPFTVILLDEFEKGHTNVADLFLQVFDDGRLTDATGETADFRHAILILTSNVGSEPKDGGGIGFGGAGAESREHQGAQTARAVRALEQSYRPEFLNRIDRILVFRPLGRDVMRRIAQRELGKLYRREGLLERDLLLEVDEGVLDLLHERGFDPKYGARPLKRAIEELLVLPLARALLGADPRRFQLLRVARRGDEVQLLIEETEASRKLANLERRSRVDDGEGRMVKLSLAEVAAGMRAVDRRLDEIAKRANIEQMRAELQAIAEKETRPGFWEEAFGKGGELYRRHRLAVEVRRFDDLRGRAQLIREMVEASFHEAEDAVADDLVAEFARLVKRLHRAERELLKFDAQDQGDALLTIRLIGGKEGGQEWVKDLADMYAGWAAERRYEVHTEETEEGFEVRIEGPYAYGYLKGEHGGHRLITPPRERDAERGETFLARVEVRSLAPGATVPPRQRDDEPPIRTYDLWRSRGVRDRRTGQADGDVRRVLGGRIDPFIDAMLEGKQAPPVEAAAGG